MIKSIEFSGVAIPSDKCISLYVDGAVVEIVCMEESGIEGVEKQVTYRIPRNKIHVKINY